jgi:hypothetical protein
MDAQLTAYRALVGAAERGSAAEPKLRSSLENFEPRFFNNLVIVLDGYFVHRARTLEGKDGNALNEFRMICTSILENGGVMCTDKTNNKTIKYDPHRSVLGLQVGDEIRLTGSAFAALAEAFFAEIEVRFMEPAMARAG